MSEQPDNPDPNLDEGTEPGSKRGSKKGTCSMHGAGHVNCKAIAEFLAQFLDGELDEMTRAQFELHMKLCPPCGHHLDAYRKTIEMIRRCGRSEKDPAHEGRCAEGLIQRILAAKQALTGR